MFTRPPIVRLIRESRYTQNRIVGEGASATVGKGFLPSGGEMIILSFLEEGRASGLWVLHRKERALICVGNFTDNCFYLVVDSSLFLRFFFFSFDEIPNFHWEKVKEAPVVNADCIFISICCWVACILFFSQFNVISLPLISLVHNIFMVDAWWHQFSEFCSSLLLIIIRQSYRFGPDFSYGYFHTFHCSFAPSSCFPEYFLVGFLHVR